jgi:hypothetical protein
MLSYIHLQLSQPAFCLRIEPEGWHHSYQNIACQYGSIVFPCGCSLCPSFINSNGGRATNWHPTRVLLQAPAAAPTTSPSTPTSASLPVPQTLAGTNATLGVSQVTFTVGVQAYLWGYPLVSLWKLYANNGYFNRVRIILPVQFWLSTC